MVNTGVYRGDNGFKPGYLTHLKEALKISCPTSPVKKYPNAKQWRSKSFIHYEKCCLVFGNDHAIREDAFDVVDAVEELGGDNESNSENGSDPIASEEVESVTSEVTNNPNKRKKYTSDGGLTEYMISAAQILGSELSKASNDISAAINADRDMRHLVVAAMEEVPEISEVDRTMYNAKIMGHLELVQAFLSCKDPFHLACGKYGVKSTGLEFALSSRDQIHHQENNSSLDNLSEVGPKHYEPEIISLNIIFACCVPSGCNIHYFVAKLGYVEAHLSPAHDGLRPEILKSGPEHSFQKKLT
ncbi:hypothetical protein Syun_001124 [Stephania yunnanensis]|uniref:Uncharacterized protein n=1 Tax=Stephania yunnanensis TaxID=152371 RepID=A0AAP0Q7F6_9MAGN